MNERLQQNLEDARRALLDAQTRLYFARIGILSGDLRDGEALVCRAIDRAWDAQCMAQGSLL